MSSQASKEHWDKVYRTKAADSVSWFRPHLETSIALIRQTGIAGSEPIIDIGGGSSTLVDDLLEAGFTNITVLDISEASLAIARQRLGLRATSVTWLADDVTRVALPQAHYSVWHDRAVFHFLTDDLDRDRYVAQACHAVASAGFVIVGTFGPEGPLRCSGLPTVRYDAGALQAVFGDEFQLIDHVEERHITPAGDEQQFVYCLCQRKRR